jgi:hypothetical protein
MEPVRDRRSESALSLLWNDLRRPASYQMLVVVVALSMKVYSVYF